MFIIQGRQARSELREQREVDVVVDYLAGIGYQPALRRMVEAASTAAALPKNELPASLLIDKRSAYRRPSQENTLAGEILFSGDRAFLLQPGRCPASC